MHRSLAPDPPSGPERGEGRTRDPRTSRLFVGQLALEGGTVTKIRIRNLSQGGFGARSDIMLQPGQRGHMLLAGIGLVTGRVAWARQYDFGLQFDTRIDPEQVRIAPPAAPTKSEFVVPPRFRPVTDHRRPGFRVR